MSGDLTKVFRELEQVGEAYDKKKDRYPYYAILHMPDTESDMLGYFLDELGAGLKGVDHNLYVGPGGYIKFSFQSAEDRETLFRARAGDEFGYNVRKRMETPGPGFRR